jgi:hypothetical protein
MKKKVGNKWKVYSHTTGKLLGTYGSEKAADEAIARHKRFGKKKRKK